ncbi:MAG: hypothetical protein PVH61_43885 [Candidatus Aminicenantes bacterium]|jgi:hypothetical protein
MLKQEVLGEKLMSGVKAGLLKCLEPGNGCDCTGGRNFTSSSDVWLDYIERCVPQPQ